MKKILVVGAGAIGCFLGGCLATQGHEVTLLGRPRLMDKIKAAGLTLAWPQKPAHQVNPHTAVDMANLTPPYDFIFLTVKSYDVGDTLAQLIDQSGLLTDTFVITMQNGVGSDEQVAHLIGRERVIAGTLTIPIQVPEPGVIAVRKAKGGIGLAPMYEWRIDDILVGLSQNQPHALRRSQVIILANSLERAGMQAEIFEDYREMKWSKLLLNMVNNATSAILDESPETIIKDARLYNLELEALREAVRVMDLHHITAVPLPGYPTDSLAWLMRQTWMPLFLQRAIMRPFVRSGRGGKMPSLHLDLANGRPQSEVNVLNGAVVTAAQESLISTPVNKTLTDILSRIVAGEIPWSAYQHQPDQLLAAIHET